jgi:hypothetical protein
MKLLQKQSFVAKNQNFIIGIVGAVALITIGYLAYQKFIAEPKQEKRQTKCL